MAVFENHSVLLELKTLPFKEKKKVRLAITDNGGSICFVVSKQCSLIVTSGLSNLSSNRLRSIQKHQTPVVGVDYVYKCLSRGVLLPVDEYKLDTSSPSSLSPSPVLSLPKQAAVSHKVPKQTSQAVTQAPNGQVKPHYPDSQRAESPERSGNILEKFRIYTETDYNLPTFPDNFQVAKYSVFEKINNTLYMLELQCAKGENGRQYRVVQYCINDIEAKKAAAKDKLVFVPTSEDALQVYLALIETLKNSGMKLSNKIPPQARALVSGPLQQLLLEEKLNTGTLSEEVGIFVELLWTEALGCLGNVLRVPIHMLSLNDVSRAEGLLLQAQKKLMEDNNSEVATLLKEFYDLLPHSTPLLPPSVKLISQKLDFCQLIRDVLNVSEMTLKNPMPSCVGKYRALRCNIEAVSSSSSEFQAVSALLQDSRVQIKQVLCVSRGVELQMFKSELGNIRPLLHSSSPSNFVGILSRGLLLPRVGVEHHGIERTDIGNMGSGIYFSDAISTSLKYSSPSTTDGYRLLLVCEVALGRCSDLHKKDFTLTQAPEGYHSVHGVRHNTSVKSEFEDDEYVVYSPDQVKLKYVVQFSLQGDQLQEFRPPISTLAELPSFDQGVYMENEGLENIKNPQDDVKAGLLDSSGQQLPLQAVHVKGKLIDLLAEVIIFQKYTNTSSVPIEAKYVFPLDQSAAVCGFEAFINGKHVVGQVKEKETARKEYKQAIEEGHGAYLMDQDAPDVFTISVGNLPPGATVLIKVTFVSELIVKDGSIFFSLPGSVAPWQESEALNQTTQVTLEKVCMTDVAASTREFSLDMSIEMPYEIARLHCLTHQVKIKRTDCKAVLSVLPGLVMGPEGFQLSIILSEVHLPRMWVEKHPDKNSQACMLVFYPHFEINSSSGYDEVILLLDTSESMKGESLHMAQRIALQVLKALPQNLRINVILFGTDYNEAFLTARPMVEARNMAEVFIQSFVPVGGSTELWRPLQALSLLPPTRGIRNLLLLSDGHIQNQELTLKLIRDNAQHSRIFTCGLSETANRHMLRALAQAGAGAYEFFDTKTKHTWAEKVACQVNRMASPGCSSVSVKWQQFSPSAPSPVQAPKYIYALFNDCHTLVFGFVPHCTQATLLGNLSGQELKTMVSTSELQKTKGTFLHKLTARALIRDYEDGNLEIDEAEHEGKKNELKSYIVELSKEFSILSQFTSFVAIEERDSEEIEQGFTDIPKLIAEEDVDILPYISWTAQVDTEKEDKYSTDNLFFDLCGSFADTRDMSYESDYEPIQDVACCLMEVEESFVPSEIKQYKNNEYLMGTELAGECLLEMSGIHAKKPCKEPIALPEFGAVTLVEATGSAPPPPPPPPVFHSSDSSSALSTFTVPPPVPPVSDITMSNRICQLQIGEQQSAPPPPPPPPSAYLPTSALISAPSALPPPDLLHSYHSSLASASAFSIPPPAPSTLERPQIVRSGFSLHLSYSRASDAFSPPPPPSPRPHASFNTASYSFPLQGATGLAPPPVLHSCQYSPASAFPTGSLSSPLYVPMAPPASDFKMSAPLPSDYQSFGASASAACLPKMRKVRNKCRAVGSSQSVLNSSMVAESHKHLLQDEPLSTVRLPAFRMKARTDYVPAMTLKWTKIYQMQHTEGYWELTAELGELINVDVDAFANVFLKNKGINSLGIKARSEILRLVATLLVLQLMRTEKLEEGKLLQTLFSLKESDPRPERWEQVKKAVTWACRADRQYPCIYSRLEFGFSWESSTRQLLGYEELPPFSPLTGLNLQKTIMPVMVH